MDKAIREADAKRVIAGIRSPTTEDAVVSAEERVAGGGFGAAHGRVTLAVGDGVLPHPAFIGGLTATGSACRTKCGHARGLRYRASRAA